MAMDRDEIANGEISISSLASMDESRPSLVDHAMLMTFFCKRRKDLEVDKEDKEQQFRLNINFDDRNIQRMKSKHIIKAV